MRPAASMGWGSPSTISFGTGRTPIASGSTCRASFQGTSDDHVPDVRGPPHPARAVSRLRHGARRLPAEIVGCPRRLRPGQPRREPHPDRPVALRRDPARGHQPGGDVHRPGEPVEPSAARSGGSGRPSAEHAVDRPVDHRAAPGAADFAGYERAVQPPPKPRHLHRERRRYRRLHPGNRRDPADAEPRRRRRVVGLHLHVVRQRPAQCDPGPVGRRRRRHAGATGQPPAPVHAGAGSDAAAVPAGARAAAHVHQPGAGRGARAGHRGGDEAAVQSADRRRQEPSVMQGIDLALDRVTGIIDLAYDRLLPHAQTLLFYTIVIEIALLFLLYAFGRQETIADLIKKMVVISLFVWLIRDWQQLMDVVFTSAAMLGVIAGTVGNVDQSDLQNYVRPSRLIATGYDYFGTMIFKIGDLFGSWSPSDRKSTRLNSSH